MLSHKGRKVHQSYNWLIALSNGTKNSTLLIALHFLKFHAKSSDRQNQRQTYEIYEWLIVFFQWNPCIGSSLNSLKYAFLFNLE